MEIITIQLVEAKFNKNDTEYKRYIKLNNDNSVEFISIPDLSQISFFNNDYERCIHEGNIDVKYLNNQPTIHYVV